MIVSHTLASYLLLTAFISVAFVTPALAQQSSALRDHDTYQPIDITADRLEVENPQGIARFLGNVRVIQGGMTLTSANLNVFYDRAGAGESPSIERLDVTGGVNLTSASETVTGKWAVYDVDRRLVTFGGNVVLQRGNTRVAGDRLELDLVTGLTKLDAPAGREGGQVRGRFNVPRSEGQGEPK